MGDDERAAAVVQAFRLVHDVQAGIPAAAGQLDALAARARREGWDELERACVFGRAVTLWIAGDPRAAEPVEELIERSAAADDRVLLALGLALRSDQGFGGTDLLGMAAHDADLAKALVTLEQATGRPCERITAHTACAIALGNRWLFELSHDQYEMALAIGAAEPAGSVDFLLAPIRFNLAEQQVNWASRLFQLGDEHGVAARWDSWTNLVRATKSFPMNPSWQTELDALGLVLHGLAGGEVAENAAGVLSRLAGDASNETRAHGLLRLAIAVDAARTGPGATDADHVAAAIEAAAESISPSIHPFMYDLVLFLAATFEARPGADAGLRYARRALETQWAKRDASLRSMRAQIASVRVVAERDALSRHAHLDDLTGIANRRALDEFLSGLIHRGVRRCALVLFDVDAFKAVNDFHGHLAGDRLLVRIAQVLARGIRSSDLAVRLGGDEFAVILGDVDPASASARADALLRALDIEPLDDVAEGLAVRLSAGLATGDPSRIMEIWAAADAALYRAKALGGHVVQVAPAQAD